MQDLIEPVDDIEDRQQDTNLYFLYEPNGDTGTDGIESPPLTEYGPPRVVQCV